MDITTTISKNKVKIRLTAERWKHIVLMHPSLIDRQKQVLATIKNPDYIFRGGAGELLAVKKISQRSCLVIIYKETETDGFIITAYETTDTHWLFKKELIWNKHL
ncbi:MAG: hypothetical protein A3A58_02945 [Candidatus Blackburnbacteria bacterium RIFCSPLOWO2_01_FULL_41_27]|uniref:Phage-Barnase-EndoU-ColicinE5/D-RelE like nuclease 2 domain-containing protein n=2 Tax=Candidatus Blackburniibacteriota TaxID=1817898 RepID=A0A1G1V6Q3_9BACT|nr:MAG: hypothetical protein A3F61_01940 [Candidatus Blackburnbacteria bacterium RIFCSPHIGHO2_12_FULL_41_13b]OGY12890.1 MAG: hypothetical protein A3A58_02945 [Candidatus Blackburnbacteria bacterium RIFCSPLOWO2_01_FULL_41_27]